ncbi:hypothetical protein CC1G_04145 [Coprinopsis cinerea okayama7|uniref:Uncharacterized protein n=1 Tax=Coprinopsis cinerea (strain Okayama-7 / 130 / ATCC MYA-4618 / FGSC 9003) TaxID=240176 RepID=A8NW53_COPC7|nr:hypothetical protein CC1G_04145 [Coprinopsis cinerea okayama7\|eukprot:XP_001836832.2 hypothetical protein CC1G_04145 [Coprinopsis cinerea okayama7\
MSSASRNSSKLSKPRRDDVDEGEDRSRLTAVLDDETNVGSETPVRSSKRIRKPSSKALEMQDIPEEVLTDEDDDVCVNAMKPGRATTPYPPSGVTPRRRRAASPGDVISVHDSDSVKGVPSRRGNPFVDDEAVESAGDPSEIEEDQDRYESDFIDDRSVSTPFLGPQLANELDADSDGDGRRKRPRLGSPLFLAARYAFNVLQSVVSVFMDRVVAEVPPPCRPRNESTVIAPDAELTMRERPLFLGPARVLVFDLRPLVGLSSSRFPILTARDPDLELRVPRPRRKRLILMSLKERPRPSEEENDSSAEHSAYSNGRRKEPVCLSSKGDSADSSAAVIKKDGGEGVEIEQNEEQYEHDDDVPMPDDDWLRPTYKGLPKLKYVLLEKTSKNQKERSDDSLLSPARIKDCIDRSGPDHLQSRLFRLLTMKHYKLYANASRIDPSLIKPSSTGTSTFFNASPRMYRPTERSLSNNVCFVMTGTVAYSYLTEDAVNATSYKTTTDHRIGLYPFDGEFQRAMTLFGNLAGKTSLIYAFHGGVIPFTTRVKAGDEDRGNIVATPKKAGLFGKGIPSQPTGSNPLLSNIKRKHYPLPLAFDDKVPVFDARRKDKVFNDSDWDDLHRFPIWTRDEVPPYCLVSVGYTANTYLISTNYSANAGSPYLSLNLQFVVVHSDPVSA